MVISTDSSLLAMGEMMMMMMIINIFIYYSVLLVICKHYCFVLYSECSSSRSHLLNFIQPFFLCHFQSPVRWSRPRMLSCSSSRAFIPLFPIWPIVGTGCWQVRQNNTNGSISIFDILLVSMYSTNKTRFRMGEYRRICGRYPLY